MKNRILSILAAIAVALSLSACQNGDTEQTAPLSDSVTTVVEETAEPIEMKTIEPPEDGWTLEELNEVLYMNGQPIDLPLMFSSLGDGYEIRDKKYNDNTNKDVVGKLYYDNEFIAIVVFCELENDIEIGTLLFETSYYEDNQKFTEYIKVNGLSLNDDKIKIQNCLGNDFTMEDNIYKYYLGNQEHFIIINPNGKDHMIIINVRGEDKNE